MRSAGGGDVEGEGEGEGELGGGDGEGPGKGGREGCNIHMMGWAGGRVGGSDG